jgi:hypothetical protein
VRLDSPHHSSRTAGENDKKNAFVDSTRAFSTVDASRRRARVERDAGRRDATRGRETGTHGCAARRAIERWNRETAADGEGTRARRERCVFDGRPESRARDDERRRRGRRSTGRGDGRGGDARAHFA